MVIATLFILLFGLMLVGVPVAVALGTSTLASAYFFTDMDLMGISSKIFDGLNHYTLMAIPMFVLAGSLLARGSAAGRIINFAKSLVGHLPGGLPIAAILASIIFAAISGSSPATVAAIGSVMYGAIKQAGYNEQFAIGTIATSGTLGILIPPSVVFIVYGVIAEQSIGKLFMAGVMPGIMIGAMMMFATYILARRSGFKAQKMASFKEIVISFKEAFWALLIIFIVIGGIYGGLFTPTEAGAVSVIYAFFISYFVYKDVKFKQLHKIILDSAQTSSMIFFIIANAMLFAHFLTDERIPHQITQMIIEANVSPLMFLLIVNILLLIMGQFMEPSSVVMITVPLLLPIGMALGIDPIHLGVIIVVNMEIGMLTPPVGLNLFVASGITGLTMGQVIKASLPMTLVLLFGLALVTYIPAISLWLPNLMYGY
ncbi:TRAP transporter large permease [Arcobacter porcinus]|uniref:Sialic acid TRAP transporter permease protein SiaT n=1 Tax=Arcobacter porcinus TaxID=1935204 RepID=A0A1C0B006_9BACT|nr:TRAP transporter large permease subunit [Arcobacter porcinus]OCL96892.1 Sialic acid TRAP transporter permease protein SiaT [Aliarcobacter thereius]OCL82098.1 Sialic acid TRAP transporter permease protein SiaT [Arcobacter porcinus]OCL84980.1 Sialic acid TRAP transporter permease protein SiaT [Arcobacter porcinus]OCL86524.1 Sialic acid TRAP transporter permease protein SiaT [Arcobacter porcinus]OCL93143.1 Sialic acid TRAP transporter permease protein SiaT [Arcobacter porcinus]